MQADGPAGTTWRWRWLLWIVAVAATAVSSWVSVLVVAFADGRTCDGVASSTNRDNGLIGLLVALGVISCPWVAVMVSGRSHRLRLAVGWVLGVSLLLGFGITHMTVQSWSSVGGGFCF